FVTEAEFDAMVARGEFLEYARVFGKHSYGTPKKWLDESRVRGLDLVLEIDVQGAAQVKQKLPEAVAIFILPPSREELERRLRNRGQDSEEEIARRLAQAREEIARLRQPPRNFFLGVLAAVAQTPFQFLARRRQNKNGHCFGQLLLYLCRALHVNLEHQVQTPHPRFVQPFLRRAVRMLPEDTRVFQKFTPGDHGVKLSFGDEIITFSSGLGRPPGPGSTRYGRHRPRKLQYLLYQRRFSRARRAGNNQQQRRKPVLLAHSMFCTCSRNFSISAFISRAIPVIASASLSTPGVFESMVFASRCISCSRKSSFLPSSPAPSSNCANCWRWLRSRSNSSLISLRSASSAASCASRPGSMLLPPSNSLSRES